MVDTVVATHPNAVAIGIARAILDAAHDYAFRLGGRTLNVTIERRPGPPWPSDVPGIDEGAHGPWPPAIRVECRWPGGHLALRLEADYWGSSKRYAGMISLQARALPNEQQVLWMSVGNRLRPPLASPIAFRASFALTKRDTEGGNAQVIEAAQAIMSRAGLPLVGRSAIEAFIFRPTDGALLPSPHEAFERLSKLAILKIPFFVPQEVAFVGDPPFALPDVSTPGSQLRMGLRVDDDTESEKFAGLWPLPGGVRNYKTTLDALLQDLQDGPVSEATFFATLSERYDVLEEGTKSRRAYLNVLRRLGFAELHDGEIALTARGETYLQSRRPLDLFAHLHATYSGILEPLVIAEVQGSFDEESSGLLQDLMSVTWETRNQVNFRRNWLLSLGLTERGRRGDELTALGREALNHHRDEVEALRERLSSLLADRDTTSGDEEDAADNDVAADSVEQGAPGFVPPVPPPTGEPSGWGADRIDLTPEMLRPFAQDLSLPEATWARVAAALSAGKHLLLVGPPGTGKTELAHAIMSAARAEGYCAGAFVATASADWSTFDTIGGYALQRDGELRFRSGAMLRAIEKWQWLIVDELNRADVDRAFGELMTVLAGRTTDTAYELDDRRIVRIGPELSASHRMPKTFRVLATMNTWDKTSLFQLSYAVQRRFAIVHVDVPDPPSYAALIKRHATVAGIDLALGDATAQAIARLFSPEGLLAVRPIGPAVALDLIRYIRRRAAGREDIAGDALAEACAMLILPQLEGLGDAAAKAALEAMLATLAGWSTQEARSELRARFVDLFPHVRFPS